jgi:hypothetical protein
VVRDIAILVVSCDKYSDLWSPFFLCLRKYWPDCPYSIYLGSNCKTSGIENVHSITVGPDVDYSSNLLSMLQQVPHPWVIFWVEDRFVSELVDTANIRRLIDIARCKDADYFKLLAEPPLPLIAKSQELGEIPTRAKYRVSMTVALWKKSALMSMLRQGESAWDLEYQGAERSLALKGMFLGLGPKYFRAPLIPHIHIIIKGRVMRSALTFLTKEGLASVLLPRGLESVLSTLYVATYHVALRNIYRMKWVFCAFPRQWRR